MFLMHLHAALVSCLALMVYLWTFMACGSARGRFGIEAPATTGHPEFERYFRVQQNTLEQLVLFLPSLWLFAFSFPPLWSLIGLVWVVARVWYGIAYTRDPKTRGAPFGISLLCTVVLLLAAFVKILYILATGVP
jgi:hypothetical protein